LYSPHPQPLSRLWQRDVGANGGSPDRAFPLSRLWQRGVGANGGSPDRAFPLSRLWQRDVGAHGGSPDRAFPLSHRVAAGCRGARRFALPLFSSLARLPNGACVGKKIVSALTIPHLTVVPLR
jgi:hypothetical protein